MLKKWALVALMMFSINAHAFLVTDFDGERINVRDLSGDGRWMVVALWQLQCVLCEQHKPSIEAFHNKYKSSDAHVVGLAIDGHEYIEEIEEFVQRRPTDFPNYVVFGDVFKEQIKKETGKEFHTSPGYLVYSPDGELYQSINVVIDINDLLGYLESQFVSDKN